MNDAAKYDEMVSLLQSRLLEKQAKIDRLLRLVGWLVMERGREGEALIGNGTLQRHDQFTIETEETHAGVLVRAIPQ